MTSNAYGNIDNWCVDKLYKMLDIMLDTMVSLIYFVYVVVHSILIGR